MPMEKAAGRSVRYLRRDRGGDTRVNVGRTSDAVGRTEARKADLRSIVECLFAAHYSEHEIHDYLTGPLGCSDADAAAAVIAARS